MGVYRYVLIELWPKDREGYQYFVWTSLLLGEKETVQFRILSDSGMVTSLLYQVQYVEEKEVYLLANCCHVCCKGALENDIINKNVRS